MSGDYALSPSATQRAALKMMLDRCDNHYEDEPTLVPTFLEEMFIGAQFLAIANDLNGGEDEDFWACVQELLYGDDGLNTIRNLVKE
jgi:hypothetical protein